MHPSHLTQLLDVCGILRRQDEARSTIDLFHPSNRGWHFHGMPLHHPFAGSGLPVTTWGSRVHALVPTLLVAPSAWLILHAPASGVSSTATRWRHGTVA